MTNLWHVYAKSVRPRSSQSVRGQEWKWSWLRQMHANTVLETWLVVQIWCPAFPAFTMSLSVTWASIVCTDTPGFVITWLRSQNRKVVQRLRRWSVANICKHTVKIIDHPWLQNKSKRLDYRHIIPYTVVPYDTTCSCNLTVLQYMMLTNEHTKNTKSPGKPFANLSAFCRDSGSTDNFSCSLATVSRYLKLTWPFLYSFRETWIQCCRILSYIPSPRGNRSIKYKLKGWQSDMRHIGEI